MLISYDSMRLLHCSDIYKITLFEQVKVIRMKIIENECWCMLPWCCYSCQPTCGTKYLTQTYEKKRWSRRDRHRAGMHARPPFSSSPVHGQRRACIWLYEVLKTERDRTLRLGFHRAHAAITSGWLSGTSRRYAFRQD